MTTVVRMEDSSATVTGARAGWPPLRYPARRDEGDGMMKRALWVFVACLLAMDFAAAAESSFSKPYRLHLGWYSTFSVGVGDINGDGRDDVVASARYGPDWNTRLLMFAQEADGTMTARAEVEVGGNLHDEFRMALADLDGDGADEVVLGRGGTHGIQVVKLLPDGGVEVTTHDGPGAECIHVATADIDLDGHADIVCSALYSTASVYFGDGKGGFRSWYKFTIGGGGFGSSLSHRSIQLADVTGDGYPDFVTNEVGSVAFYVYVNNRMGGFYSGVAYPEPGTHSVGLYVADLDGDGVNEVLTTTPDNRPGAMLNVHRRMPNGYLALAERIPVHHSPTAVVAGRFGGNEGMDVAVAHYTFNALTVLGEGGAGLHSQFLHDLPGFGSHIEIGNARRQHQLAIGDLDGDGCTDLVAGVISGVMVLYGCEPFEPSMPVSDFDGDGVSDLLWFNRTSSQLEIWHWAEADYPCTRPCPWSLGRIMDAGPMGDFDGDGSTDVVFRDPVSGENLLRVGGFYDRMLTSVTNPGWRIVGAGDFDGDDQADLLWRNELSGVNAIWRSADHSSQLPIHAVTDVDWQVAAVGDFNGDRKADIFWRHAVTGRNAIWLSGRFDTQQPVTAVTGLDWEVRGAGDFNGDGRDDIVWRNVRTGANVIWLSGNFHTPRAVTGVTNTAWDIAAIGDYNGDGRSDLLWRNALTDANVIWNSAQFGDPREVSSMYFTYQPVP